MMNDHYVANERALYNPKTGRFERGLTITTAHGERRLLRRVGTRGEYAFTAPTTSAPNGEWWCHNEQRGWVPVPSNSPALLAAIEG